MPGRGSTVLGVAVLAMGVPSCFLIFLPSAFTGKTLDPKGFWQLTSRPPLLQADRIGAFYSLIITQVTRPADFRSYDEAPDVPVQHCLCEENLQAPLM
jgi:hypothetical protein